MTSNNDDDQQPKTLEELCDYISRYAPQIFVREQINGKWGSFALTELPPQQAIDHALKFIKEGRIPVRMKTPKEMEQAEKQA